MTPAEGIRKHGFRTWYERQLIESHVYFITGFMSAVLIMALLEDINLRGPGPLSRAALAAVIGAGLLTAIAMQRYLSVLMRAEFIAEHCVCAQCHSYGVIRILHAGAIDADAAAADDNPQWMQVACRKCGHEWRIETAEKVKDKCGKKTIKTNS